MQHYVTFRIEETTDGQFVLYLHNHSQQKVFETLRSKNLDEVVDKLKKEMKYRHAFTSALGNYAPVMGFMDRLEAKYPDAQTETFPKGWKDPLDLYGEYRHELEDPRFDLDGERADLLKILDKEGPEWVWKYRLKLVAERVFMTDF
jgi:hypothetical protein